MSLPRAVLPPAARIIIGGKTGEVEMQNSSSRKIATTNSSTELANIRDAAREDAAFDRVLKFKKGDFLIDDTIPVEHGTTYRAHPEAWTKIWIKWGRDADGNWQKLAEHVYSVAKGQRAPVREDLDDWPEKTNWPRNDDGELIDPWVLEYLLPLETLGDDGELIIFKTRSTGGRRAVADLAKDYARHAAKFGAEAPIIKLAENTFPSTKYGKVLKPLFDVVGWEGDGAADAADCLPASSPDSDIIEIDDANDVDPSDSIPF